MVRITWEQIEQKIGEYKEYGKYVAILCPFHNDEHESCFIYKEGFFYCAACGAKGDFYKLDRQLSGVMLPTKVKRQAVSFTPPTIPTADEDQDHATKLETWAYTAHRNLARYEEELGWYLRNRGVDDRIQPQCLGWVNGWYTVPAYDKDHRFQAVVCRADSHIQEAKGIRFWLPPNQPQVLYVPDWGLVLNNAYLFVTYGIFDALTLAHLRFPVATGMSGKHINPDLFEKFRCRIIVLPDRGEEDEALELANNLGWRGKVKHLVYPDNCKDCNDFSRTGQEQHLLNQLVGMI
jgi:hypothetical protein